MTDLDEAIRATKQIVDHLLDDDLSMCMALDTYSILLGDRYQRTGAVSDLKEALQVGERVLDPLPPDSQERENRSPC